MNPDTAKAELPPAWAEERHHFTGWTRRPNVTEEPRLMARLHPESRNNRVACDMASAAAKAQAKLCEALAGTIRTMSKGVYGDDLAKWPPAFVEKFRKWEAAASTWTALALAWHLHGGRRRDSFKP